MTMMEMMDLSRQEDRDLNRDPISGAPGAHPIGTGVGAAGGAAAGVMVGSAAGPVGTTIGGVVGAIVGALAGKELGEVVNPTTEDEDWDDYWRESYRNEPYYSLGRTYEDYAAAYRLGHSFRREYPDRDWDDAKDQLKAEWEQSKGASHLTWGEAQLAVYAAQRHAEH
jgi:hypothetical protein